MGVNLVADIEGGKQAEGVREQGVEDDVWVREGKNDKRHEGLQDL